MAGTTGRDSDKFMLRLPRGMRQRIRRAADSNGRSMNQEIIHALESHFPAGPSPKELARNIDLFLTWAQSGRTDFFKERGRESLLNSLKNFREIVEAEAADDREADESL